MDYLEALQNIKEHYENDAARRDVFKNYVDGSAVVTNELMRLRGYVFNRSLHDRDAMVKQQAIVTAAELVKFLVELT